MQKSSQKNNLQQWLQSIKASQVFSAKDLLSGHTINVILKNMIKDYKIQISQSQSTLNRVANWNILTEQLKQLSISLTQQNKNKIVSGNQDIIIDLISQLKEYHSKKAKQTEVDISQIDPKKDINQTTSLLQMLLVLIMKNFNVSSKQAVALIANQSKYFAHILTKGMKGQFKPIQNFIQQMTKFIRKIITFCSNKDNLIFFLRSIKPALISKSFQVSSSSMSFLNKFLQNYDQKQRFQIFQTHLMATYLLIMKRHPLLQNQVITSIFQMGKSNPKLLTHFLNSINQLQRQSMFLTIWKGFAQKARQQQLMSMQGFKQKFQQSISLINRQHFSITCLNIIIETYDFTNEIFQNGQLSQSLIQKIKLISLSNKAQQVVLVHATFCLLSLFGKDKHFLAPSLFKHLLQQFKTCQSSQLYYQYLSNFLEVIKEFPSIPFHLILDVIKNKLDQDDNYNLKENQLLFFIGVFQHVQVQNVDLKYVLIIFDMVSRIFLQTYYLAALIIQIMLKILQNFKIHSIVQQLTLKMVKVCLAIHFANFKKFSQKRKSLTKNDKISPEQALVKIKNNAIQFFILKISLLHIDSLNKNIQPLVAFSYVSVKEKPQFAKGFRKILAIFGKVQEIVQKVQRQIKAAQQQAKTKQKQTKQSKIKQHSKSRYENSNESRNEQSVDTFQLTQNKVQSNSVYRSMNLSQVGVTPMAQKGLDKYQKVFLDKIQRQDFQKIKKIQQEQRYQQLKKIYRKKILSFGIDLKSQNQIQYLFEFDSQQNVILEKHFSKIPYYTNQCQQDRDLNAVEKILKSYQKSLKLLYTIYSGQKKGIIPQNFDQIAQRNVSITSTGIYKFLKDFCFQDYISLKQVQYLTQKINYERNLNIADYQMLDFQGFIQFIKQVSFLMFTRPPKDLRGQPLSIMLQQTLSNLKLFASQNKMNEQIFEDPSNIFFNETQAVMQLNRKLQNNSDYILPEGYKKIVDKKIIFQYGIYLQAMSPTYKVVFQTLDDILFKALDIHIVQPFTKIQKITRARPSLFVAERLKMENMPVKHIPVKMKKQIAKIPITSRQTAKQCAITLNQIIQAIQLGHDSIGKMHLNNLQQERKKIDQQQRKQYLIDKKKRDSRNRVVKSVLQQNKVKVIQKQRQVSQKKKTQQQRLKQQKQRKTKQQLQLKKKIEQYNKKRKQQQSQKLIKKKQLQQKQRKQRQKQKQQNDDRLKKIEQQKKRRQDQQKLKKQQKQKQQHKIKQDNKKKMMESQIIKKKMVQQFKMKKSGVKIHNTSVDQHSKNLQNLF